MVGVFGVPDMGGVCSEKHVPNYLQNVSALLCCMLCSKGAGGPAHGLSINQRGGKFSQVDKLEEAGVKKVVCLAVAEPEEVSEWADKVGLTGSKIEVWADTKGAWTRMLGLDVNQYDEPGPRSQR